MTRTGRKSAGRVGTSSDLTGMTHKQKDGLNKIQTNPDPMMLKPELKTQENVIRQNKINYKCVPMNKRYLR